MELSDVQTRLREFAAAREWGQFHSPKNLAMALSVEVSELVEVFQWLTTEESQAVPENPDRLRAVEEEMADVMIYLLRLADVLGVDLEQAVEAKIAANSRRYTVEASKGSANKIPKE